MPKINRFGSFVLRQTRNARESVESNRRFSKPVGPQRRFGGPVESQCGRVESLRQHRLRRRHRWRRGDVVETQAVNPRDRSALRERGTDSQRPQSRPVADAVEAEHAVLAHETLEVFVLERKEKRKPYSAQAGETGAALGEVRKPAGERSHRVRPIEEQHVPQDIRKTNKFLLQLPFVRSHVTRTGHSDRLQLRRPYVPERTNELRQTAAVDVVL